MSKEAVYDSKISPLMDEIIEVCEYHKIACVCSFNLGGDLFCTTALTNQGQSPPHEFLLEVSMLTEALNRETLPEKRKMDGPNHYHIPDRCLRDDKGTETD